MKYLLLIVGLIQSFLFCSCQNPSLALPDTSKNLKLKGDTLYFEKELFTGIIFHIENGYKEQTTDYRLGLMHGKMIKYNNQGAEIELRNYSNNKKDGRQQGWWSNGKPKFDYHIKNDAFVGLQAEWYENGQPYSEVNYDKNGQPEGQQTSWFNNGKIRYNYTIKNGKRYGFFGSLGCIGQQAQTRMALTK